MYDEDYSDLFSNGLASSYAKPVGDEPSFLDRFIGSVGTGENGEGGSGLLGGLSNKNLLIVTGKQITVIFIVHVHNPYL